MSSYILNGASASGLLVPSQYMYLMVDAICIDAPMVNPSGIVTPYVQLSGAVTGTFRAHSDMKMELRFKTDEKIYLTTSGFTSDYMATVSYVQAGSSAGVYIDKTIKGLSLPSRLTRSPRNGS